MLSNNALFVYKLFRSKATWQLSQNANTCSMRTVYVFTQRNKDSEYVLGVTPSTPLSGTRCPRLENQLL